MQNAHRTSASMKCRPVSFNSASQFSCSDWSMLRTSSMSVLFNHVFPSTVISTSPSGRYVLSGTDPNAKTWIINVNTKTMSFQGGNARVNGQQTIKGEKCNIAFQLTLVDPRMCMLCLCACARTTVYGDDVRTNSYKHQDDASYYVFNCKQNRSFQISMRAPE
jgi:hypothetical protein